MKRRFATGCALALASIATMSAVRADTILYTPEGQQALIQHERHDALCALRAELAAGESDSALEAGLIHQAHVDASDAATAVRNARRESGCSGR